MTIGKAVIQLAQPGDGVRWLCYLDSGARGLGPMGFGDTPEEAYENWRFDLIYDIGPFCSPADYREARALWTRASKL